MSIFPLDIQRMLEERWAARFVPPVASAAPKNIGPKGMAPHNRRRATNETTKTDDEAELLAAEAALQTAANDNKLAWPFIPFPEGWY